MKRLIYGFVIAILCGFVTPIMAALISPNEVLIPGQSIVSDNRQYALVMQQDGNLVYYRLSDYTVRFNSQTHGNPNAFAAMQGDGNLVVYRSDGLALWNSSTQGRPGAYLAVQDDGNLVVYSAGSALWNIGADIGAVDPGNVGDVVGRDLRSPFPMFESLGHIGLWDGYSVYEVLNEPSVVQRNALSNFKIRTTYWGKGSPNIPNYYVIGCYLSSCGSTGSYQTVNSRMQIANRAWQVYVLGADYTYTTAYRRAEPKFEQRSGSSTSAVRGIYRCDTFVYDLYQPNGTATTDGYNQNYNRHQIDWFQFLAGDLRTPFTPLSMFTKLASYRGA